MALNRDKFRKIVGGITTPEKEETPEAQDAAPAPATVKTEPPQTAAGQGVEPAGANGPAEASTMEEHRRFAKRGRPKARKDDAASGKTRKVKVSLFLSEYLINDFYDWAHDDKIHPGEMFEKALKPFHEKEAKRRKAGKE
jgi:hypothetical protein